MLDAMLRKALADSKLAVKADSDPGEISGYASVFNVVDAQGDIVRPGAFAKSCRERVAAGKVALMIRHFANGGDVAESIGTIAEAKEDDKGLWIKCNLFPTQVAQETREKVKASPGLFGLSIGYKIVRSADIRDADGNITGKELNEVALYEVTLTMMPANEETTGTASAKNVSEINELRERLAAVEAAIKPKQPEGTGEAKGKATPAAISYAGTIARNKRLISLLELEA